MKKLFLGIALMFVSVVMYGIVHIAAVGYMNNITRWPTSQGRYLTAISETGGIQAFYLSMALFVIGLLISVWSVLGPGNNKMSNEDKLRK